MFEIRKWYDERKTVTRVHSLEEAYEEYTKERNCDTIQVYFLMGRSETPILLAQKDC
nr:MAG TPA: hypothetical protein [Bacteriophage sp.]